MQRSAVRGIVLPFHWNLGDNLFYDFDEHPSVMIYYGIKKFRSSVSYQWLLRWNPKTIHPIGNKSSDDGFKSDVNQRYDFRSLKETFDASQVVRETATNRPGSYNVDVDMTL